MTLRDYLSTHRLTAADFARLHGACSVSGVRKWLAGEAVPRAFAMRRILEVTDGAVTADSFFQASRTANVKV